MYALFKDTFQARVAMWTVACFGKEISCDKVERNHRFVEEALELAQACDCTASEAHQLVDYVFNRPVGDKKQEVGGVALTLAALCNAHDINDQECAETELSRVWTHLEKIRAKQLTKPKHSPLPSSDSERDLLTTLAVARIELDRANRDVEHWKANHANEVRRSRLLKERIDMPVERVAAYEWMGIIQGKYDELLKRSVSRRRALDFCELSAPIVFKPADVVAESPLPGVRHV